jgi:hypothetical protein
MSIEPILYTNLYGEKLILASGEIVDSVHSDEWKFITPEFYHQRFIENFLSLVKENNLNSKKDLYVIHTDSFGIPQLRNLKLTPQQISNINENGLKIFLTEILVKYQGASCKLDRSDLALPNNIDLLKFRFDFNNQNIGCIQLDDIKEFVSNNSLKNVTVYIIEKDYKNIFSKYDSFKIKYYDSFLVEHLNKIKKGTVESKIISYKFLSTSFRYSPHRHLIMSILSNKNSKLSWAFTGTIENINKNLYFDVYESRYYNEIINGLNILNKNAPLSLDIEYKKINITGNIDDIFLLPEHNILIPNQSANFSNTFCSVVNESEFFECTSNVSEKTLWSIKNKKPFVVVGSPETLRLLKELGFKTFNDYWPEDYDNHYDSKNRFDSICDTIEYIDKFNLTQCADMLKDMQSILDHNFSNLQELKSRMTL